MDIQLLLQTLQQTVTAQAKMIAGLQALNKIQATQIVTMDQLTAALQAEVAILKNNVPPPLKKNSNNSHLPPSQDQNRPKKIKACANQPIENLVASPATRALPYSAAPR